MGRDASLFQKEAFFMMALLCKGQRRKPPPTMAPLCKGQQRKPHPNHGSLVQRGAFGSGGGK